MYGRVVRDGIEIYKHDYNNAGHTRNRVAVLLDLLPVALILGRQFAPQLFVGRVLRAHRLRELPVVGVHLLLVLLVVHPHVFRRHALAVHLHVPRVGRDHVVVRDRYEPRRYERAGHVPALAHDEIVRGQRRVDGQHLYVAPVLARGRQHHLVHLAAVRVVAHAQHHYGRHGLQVEQHRQRVLGHVTVVVYVPRHDRVGEAHHRTQHHEVVVQPEPELAVPRYHDAVPDVVVVQHGHVRLAVVVVRAHPPAPGRLRPPLARDHRRGHRPRRVPQRHCAAFY